MQIIQGIQNSKNMTAGPVCLALGNFDGVHAGHRKILSATTTMAKTKQLKSAVLLFYPHPLSVLFPDHAPALLMSVGDRIRLLGEAGIDYVIIHPFSREFAAITPEAFVADYLYNQLSVAGIVVGFDYSFGAHGRGTPDYLTELGKRFGFPVRVVKPVTIENEIVGSTLIRYYLSQGSLDKANKLLGYPFFLRGHVVHGDGRGRQLGFPTANILPAADVVLPAFGVYLTKVCGQDINAWAITNIGNRPTFQKKEPSVEVHLFDVDKNLYGQELQVYFLYRMREERSFNHVDELVRQVNRDMADARQEIANLTIHEIPQPCYARVCYHDDHPDKEWQLP